MESSTSRLSRIEGVMELLPHTFAWAKSGGKWQAFDYLAHIGMEIAKAVHKGNGRIIVNMPPRVGKTKFIGQWVPLWFLNLFPEKFVILCSYAAEIAEMSGRIVRNEIENNDAIDLELSGDSTAADNWHTSKGGGMITAGIGGPITGKGGHLLLIDDPIKNWKDASSETLKMGQREWFQSTFYTRAEPGATIVILMHRWTEDDLCGWLEAEHSDKWKVIKFPAVAEENDVLGRTPGKALCPKRYDEAAYERIRLGVGEQTWAGLYQQRPAPAEGKIFKKQWWKYWDSEDDLPHMDVVVMSWDLTFDKKNDAAYNVGQAIGMSGNNFYLLGQSRAKAEFTEQIDMIELLHQKHHSGIPLIENKANGAAVISVLKRKFPGIVAIEVKGSKELRAMSVSPLVQSGNVFLPNPSYNPSERKWVSEFIDRFAMFPNVKYKDEIDALIQGITWLRENAANFGFSPFSMEKNSTWGV